MPVSMAMLMPAGVLAGEAPPLLRNALRASGLGTCGREDTRAGQAGSVPRLVRPGLRRFRDGTLRLSRCATWPLLGGVGGQPELSVERRDADAEHLRCLALVPAAGFDYPHDVRALELGGGLAQVVRPVR